MQLLILLRVLGCSALADDADLDLAGVIQLVLDLLGDITCQQNDLVVADLVGLDKDADLAACLHGVGALDALKAVAEGLQCFQTLDVALHVLAAGTGTGSGNRVGGHDDERQRRLGLHVAVVGLDGVDDLRVLAVFLADVNADLDVAAFDLVVKGFADVMQQTGAAGQLASQATSREWLRTFWPKLVRYFRRPMSLTRSGCRL